MNIIKKGEKFGRLIVLKECKPHILPCRQIQKKVLCQCECGNTREIRYASLKNGHTKSCGCLGKENSYKHGMSKNNKFYTIWCNMEQRCNNKNNQRYKYYGSRGIIVCKEWLKFENFKNDMYQSYLKHKKNNKQTTIERINNNLGYSKENCKWATMKEQNNNTRNNHLLVYKGKTLNITQWSKKLNISRDILYYRINKLNWSIKKSLQNYELFKKI